MGPGFEVALYLADSENAVYAEKLKHIEQEGLPFDPGVAEFDLGSADADLSNLLDLTDGGVLSAHSCSTADLIVDATLTVSPAVAFLVTRQLWSAAITANQSGVLAPSAAYDPARIIAVRSSHIDRVLSEFDVRRVKIPEALLGDPKRRPGQLY